MADDDSPMTPLTDFKNKLGDFKQKVSRSSVLESVSGVRQATPLEEAQKRQKDRETERANTRRVGLNQAGAAVDESSVEFGKCSVFDVFLQCADNLPFDVPAEGFLDEVLIGLNGAPQPTGSPPAKKDKTVAEDEPPSPQMRSNYNRLRRLIHSKALVDATVKLFWIALGVVTNRTMPDVVEQLRSALSQAWSLVVIEVDQQVRRDQEARDFLLGALPAILVQTIYRLFVDCFQDDKTQFVQHADPLLEKLSHIVTYEVSGFQKNIETNLKERRQLFRKVVLDSPFVNQRDSVKAQMRQDLLVQNSKEARALTFGTTVEQGGQPLEETQLQHVMLHHDEKKTRVEIDERTQEPIEPTFIPKELDVDRYARVACRGTELFDRQLNELDYMPKLPPAPRLPQHLPNEVRMPEESAPTLSSSASAPALEDETPTSSQPSVTSKRSSMLVANMKAHAKKNMFALHMFSMKGRAVDEKIEKRRRVDQLTMRIVNEPLPPELCERALDTTWVSPITNRLAPGERDRQALRKPSSEAYHLKMALPNTRELPSLVSRSRSAPELRALNGGSQELPKLGVTMRMAAAVGSLENMDMNGAPALDGLASASASPSGAAKLGASQKDVKAHAFGVTNKVASVAVAEDLILEPPPSLSQQLVMQRLKGAGESFQANSFGQYVKEFEVTSGVKKLRMDPTLMRKAETTYITSMQALVGPPERPALKMYESPMQMARRRMKPKPTNSLGMLGSSDDRRSRTESGHSSWSEQGS